MLKVKRVIPSRRMEMTTLEGADTAQFWGVEGGTKQSCCGDNNPSLLKGCLLCSDVLEGDSVHLSFVDPVHGSYLGIETKVLV